MHHNEFKEHQSQIKNNHTNKKSFIKFIIGILLVLSIYLAFGSRGYYMVQMETGDVYFGYTNSLYGKFITLKNPHIIDGVTVDSVSSGNDILLTPLLDAFYGPKNIVKLDHNHILLIQPLAKNSKILDALNL